MDRESLRKAGVTDEETITNILNSHHGSEAELKKAREELAKAKAITEEAEKTAKEVTEQLNEINKSKLSDEEQIAADKAAAAKELADARKIKAEAQVRNVLAGLEIPDSIIQTMVSDDVEKSAQSANDYKTYIESVKENTTKATKESLANIDVKPDPTNIVQTNEAMTKEAFAKLTMAEKKKFKDENLEQYREWYPTN